MPLLHRYLTTTVMRSITLTWLLLVIIRVLIHFIEQMDDLGDGGFELVTLGSVILLDLPGFIYEFFPLAVLVGGMVGLGVMASSNELTIMRSVGMTSFNIGAVVVKAVMFVAVLVLAFGEWVVPYTSDLSQQLRADALNEGQLIRSRSGFWAKADNTFIHMQQVMPEGRLVGVTLYNMDDGLQLQQIIHAKQAVYIQTDRSWLLDEVTRLDFSTNQVSQSQFDMIDWSSILTPGHLNQVALEPNSLSLAGLSSYIDYLEQNQLNSQSYRLAYWRKLLQPLTTGMLIYLAISFIFGPMRQITVSSRIIAGITVGFVTFILFETMAQVSLVYAIPPFLSAIAPLILLFMIGSALLARSK